MRESAVVTAPETFCRVRRAREWVAALLALLVPVLSVAQGRWLPASYEGKVIDERGQVVDGASVALMDLVRDERKELVTDAAGRFAQRDLPPSEYLLRIEKPGYRDYQRWFELTEGERMRQEIVLAPASALSDAFEQGRRALAGGDFEAAVEAFEEVTRGSPESPKGHANLARAYFGLGKAAEAVQELEKAAELSADSFRSWTELAQGYLRVGRSKASMRAFERALAKEHEPSDPVAIESWMTLGALYFEEGRDEHGVKAYEEALSVSPSAAPALLALGKHHLDRGDFGRARNYFERVTASDASASEKEEAESYLAEIGEAEPPLEN